MYFHAFATDYDGTLAHGGLVDEGTTLDLERLRSSGRRLILVTGRELEDLERVFSRLDLFDLVVLENGGVIYRPQTREEKLLGPPPDPGFVGLLRARGVDPISVGRTIVATWEPHHSACLDAIRKLGLELEIIFNKGAVMVLPTGVNKATGLAAALEELKLSRLNVIAIGDAENDHAMLRFAGCGIAVANALPPVKDTADLTTVASHGAGVAEVIEALLDSEDKFLTSGRHSVELGQDEADQTVCMSSAAGPLLIAGSSGIGKSTLATALTERFVENEQQFVVIDPEGDYEGLHDAVAVGSANDAPWIPGVISLLEDPRTNVVVNAFGVAVRDRPDYLRSLLPELGRLRARTGRPHWIVMDEAHHLLPAAAPKPENMETPGLILITVHPEAVSGSVIAGVAAIVALGPEARQVVAAVFEAKGRNAPDLPIPREEHVLVVNDAGARLVLPIQPAQERKRHQRKYAVGTLAEESSFYFTGPESALNLRAHNLETFLLIAEGVDDHTWEHHRWKGDYSRWMKEGIKDKGLSREVANVEHDAHLDATTSRQRVAELVQRRYTAPASASET